MTLFCTTFSIVMTVSSVRNASYYYLKLSLIVVGIGWLAGGTSCLKCHFLVLLHLLETWPSSLTCKVPTVKEFYSGCCSLAEPRASEGESCEKSVFSFSICDLLPISFFLLDKTFCGKKDSKFLFRKGKQMVKIFCNAMCCFFFYDQSEMFFSYLLTISLTT